MEIMEETDMKTIIYGRAAAVAAQVALEVTTYIAVQALAQLPTEELVEPIHNLQIWFILDTTEVLLEEVLVLMKITTIILDTRIRQV